MPPSAPTGHVAAPAMAFGGTCPLDLPDSQIRKVPAAEDRLRPSAEAEAAPRLASQTFDGQNDPTSDAADHNDPAMSTAALVASKRADQLPTFTLQEVARHCTEDDAWIVIAGKVYDVTTWQKSHPGGHLPLLGVAGCDATDVFRATHPGKAWELLPQFVVGILDPSTTESSLDPQDRAMLQDYRKLSQSLFQRGLTRPNPAAYLRQAAVLAPALAVIIAGVVMTSSPLVHLLCAMALGLWWNQVSFIGHDAGHNSITGDRQCDSAIGYFVGNFLTGISIGWWKRTHNVHHVVCNSVDHDPDLQHVPVFAVSNSFFKSLFSHYHSRQMTFDFVARLLVSQQHLTFYPIMAIARINLYIQSLLLVFSSKPLSNRGLEIVSMALFWVWFPALLMCLPTMWERVVFFLVSHAVTGILHVQICVSHFGSPTYEGRRDAALWPKTQAEGTVDISCSPWTDWFHGGLQFQLEHHLFPRVPRHNLRQIVPDVRAFCEKHDISYVSVPFLEANVRMLKVLHGAAMDARIAPYTDSSKDLFSSLLWDAMNARG